MKADRRWWNDGRYLADCVNWTFVEQRRPRRTLALLRAVDGSWLLVPMISLPTVLVECSDDVPKVEVEL